MLGFAALDRVGSTVAVWLVSHTDANAADSTNAVVLDLEQPEAAHQLHALTRDRVAVLTPGSDPAGLPLDHPQPATLARDLIAATTQHQQAIVEAIHAHAATRKNQKLTAPTFPSDAELPHEWPTTPQERAMELARTLARAWTVWLASDGERLRRTVQPRTGITPWIMPNALNQPELLLLPPAMAGQLQPEPIEAYQA